MVVLISSGFVGCLLGGFSIFLIARYFENEQTREAQIEAQDLLDQAKGNASELMDDTKAAAEEKVATLQSKAEPEIEKLTLSVEALTIRHEDLQAEVTEKLDEIHKHRKEQKKKLQKQDNVVRQKRNQLDELRKRITDKKTEYSNRLTEISGEDQEAIKAKIAESFLKTITVAAHKLATSIEEDAKHNAEEYARKILNVALNRFARPYCAERGIGFIAFPDEKTREYFMKDDGLCIKEFQKLVGVDLLFDEENPLHISIAGLDPVRRELARRSLSKLFKQKKHSLDIVKRTVGSTKKELFKQIIADGKAMARELNLRNFHPEVIQMMGSLRYRYSYTQNQYYHCGEVGWLCGLLASQLGVNIKDARRAGLLHDIGKSMDHNMDGGHAMIGATFCQERNEPEHIVHAIRAHHYDVDPSSPLAFLVIAADAISGARPGARRSVLESYNQKIVELATICDSYEGVDSSYILNGGREVRVIVDERKYSDIESLELSASIAKQIEETCAYPGQIKVVVIRRTEAVTEAVAK